MICPKCEYERNGYERVPDWQCPACDVVYHKIEAIDKEVNEQRERWKKEDEDVRQRIEEFMPFSIFCLALFIGYFSYFLISGETSFGVVWPITLGVVLLLLCKKMATTGIFFHRSLDFTPRERYPANFKIELLAGIGGGVWLIYIGCTNFLGAL